MEKMRILLLIMIFFALSCKENKKTGEQTHNDTAITSVKAPVKDTSPNKINYWMDRRNRRQIPLPDSINGKPLSFYLNHPKVSAIGKALYKGEFLLTNTDSITTLLSYVTTTDSVLRPFYRWCLNFIISIHPLPMAVPDYVGDYVLEYATKFPQEFFSYMDKDTSGRRYRRWVEITAYIWLFDRDKSKQKWEQRMIGQMNKSCLTCDSNTKKRIITFIKTIADEAERQEIY